MNSGLMLNYVSPRLSLTAVMLVIMWQRLQKAHIIPNVLYLQTNITQGYCINFRRPCNYGRYNLFFCVETRDYSGNQNDQKINSSSISDVLGV